MIGLTKKTIILTSLHIIAIWAYGIYSICDYDNSFAWINDRFYVFILSMPYLVLCSTINSSISYQVIIRIKSIKCIILEKAFWEFTVGLALILCTLLVPIVVSFSFEEIAPIPAYSILLLVLKFSLGIMIEVELSELILTIQFINFRNFSYLAVFVFLALDMLVFSSLPSLPRINFIFAWIFEENDIASCVVLVLENIILITLILKKIPSIDYLK